MKVGWHCLNREDFHAVRQQKGVNAYMATHWHKRR